MGYIVPWGAAPCAPFCYDGGVARNSLISVLAAQPLLRAGILPARPLTGEVPGPTEGEVPFVADGHIQNGQLGVGPRCGYEGTLGGEYCPEVGEIEVDGLRLCGRHADRLRLQERVTYWRAILAHVDLWSGGARRRGRDDLVGLLEVERAGASAALERASLELQRDRDGRSPDGPDDGFGQDGEGPPRWPPLLLMGLPVAGRPPEGF